MSAEKRLWTRFSKVIDGSFHVKGDTVHGDLIMTDVSRSGVRASLNCAVAPGSFMSFIMRVPPYFVPLFAIGRVVWVREKGEHINYGYDVGIQLQQMDTLDEQRVMGIRYEDWYLEQVAEYALQRGYLAHRYPETSLNLTLAWPSVMVLYFLIGGLVSLFSPVIAALYAGSFIAYFMFVFAHALGAIHKEKGGRTVSLRVVCLASAGTVLTNICYGLFFIIGFWAAACEQ